MSSWFNGAGVKFWFDTADSKWHVLVLDGPGSANDVEVSDADLAEALKAAYAIVAGNGPVFGSVLVFELALSGRND